MSSSLTLFACIENLDRVISCLLDRKNEEEQEIKQDSEENGGSWDVENDDWTSWGNDNETETVHITIIYIILIYICHIHCFVIICACSFTEIVQKLQKLYNVQLQHLGNPPGQ